MAVKGFKRKLTAILSADAVEYSRLMGEDEAATVHTLKTYKEVMASHIQQYRGRVVDSPGDNLLAEFISVVDALDCAVKIQNELKVKNSGLPEKSRMQFRIGVNLGDVIEDEERIYGDGVNVAARVEGLADVGGICVSGTAYDQIAKKLPLGYEYLGEQTVKNIEKPVRVYRVLMDPEAAGKVIGEKRFLSKLSRRTAMAAIIILAIVAGGLVSWNIYLQQSKKVEPASVEKMAFPLPDKPSIAVLPFDNMSGDSDQEYIADGITENIITALSRVSELFVIARNSTFTYKGKPVKIKQVSEELGVRYVLEGSVQKEGDRVRIAAQLIDAIKGHHMWAEQYNRDMEGYFDLLDEITQDIATALQIELTVGNLASYVACTTNFEAWSYLTKAYSFHRRNTRKDTIKALELAERALKLDSEYACAYVLIALIHFNDALKGWSESRTESFKNAVEFTKKSLAIDSENPGAHIAHGYIYLYQRKYDKAIAEGRKAVAIDPNLDVAYASLGYILYYAGRPEESIELVKKGMRLNPHYSPWYFSLLARSYLLAGQYEEAIKADKLVIKGWKKEGGNISREIRSHVRIAEAYVELGREDEARIHAAEVLKMNPNFSIESWQKTHNYKDPHHLERRIQALRRAGLK